MKDTSMYHPVTGQIFALLDGGGYWYETFEHEPVRTSEEAAQVRTGYTLAQGPKALILNVRNTEADRRFVMVVLSGDQKFNSEKVREILQCKRVRFATEEEVADLTGGVQVGGVPPLGNLFNLPTYVDSGLFHHEKIIFNAGDRRFSVGMLSKDYQVIVNPTIVQLVS